tara:strand:+ start:5412 stop:5612 length:201 start_codon:yes stop_codon:yes gene_type:complete
MKANIQFEVPDTYNEEKDKEKLIEEIVGKLEDWLNGKGIINITFTTDYENDKYNTFINWETDNTLN